MAAALSLLLFQAVAASADDAPPKATAARPAQDRPGQTSLPNDAPPATRTTPTESTNQGPTVKQMNDEGKEKLKVEGK
jgi:hypothetical protein